jgi:hypothetical protein
MATFSSLLILLVAGFNSIYSLILGYFPYVYAFIPLQAWFALVATIMVTQCLMLVKQYGTIGLKYAAYLPIYNIFSTYAFAAFIKSLFIKSWQNTKTLHGFVTNRERERIERRETV